MQIGERQKEVRKKTMRRRSVPVLHPDVGTTLIFCFKMSFNTIFFDSFSFLWEMVFHYHSVAALINYSEMNVWCTSAKKGKVWPTWKAGGRQGKRWRRWKRKQQEWVRIHNKEKEQDGAFSARCFNKLMRFFCSSTNEIRALIILTLSKAY